MHPAKPGVFYQNGGTFPNKNRNFDTKRIEVTVLAFYAKILCLWHFCTQRPQKKTRPGCFPGRVFAFAWALWSS